MSLFSRSSTPEARLDTSSRGKRSAGLVLERIRLRVRRLRELLQSVHLLHQLVDALSDHVLYLGILGSRVVLVHEAEDGEGAVVHLGRLLREAPLVQRLGLLL